MTEAQGPAPARRQINQREKVMLLVLLGAVVVGALYFVMTVLLGGDEEPGIAGPPGAPAPPATARPSPSPTDEATSAPETFGAFVGRDPFEPLVGPGSGGGDAGEEGGGGGGADEEGSVGGKRIVLLDIFSDEGTRKAVVEVDGKEYTVEEGETFADNFMLDNLTSECGDFTFGDEGFRLCVGQETRK